MSCGRGRNSGRGDQKSPSFRGRRPWNPPWRAEQSNSGRGRVKVSVIQRGAQAPRGIPHGGQGSPLSLPRWNHMGDSSVAALPLNDVRKVRCAAGCIGDRWKRVRNARTVDAGTQRFPSFRGRRPWNPPWRAEQSSSGRGRGSWPFPSSSHSGDPPVRGGAVRCRYPGRTYRGILRSLTLPLNDVQYLSLRSLWMTANNSPVPHPPRPSLDGALCLMVQ